MYILPHFSPQLLVLEAVSSGQAARGTPVVGAPGHTRAANPTRPERTKMGTPFPWLPMMAISVCLVTVAYALCNLFPYVGYMVQDLGVTDDKDGAGKFSSIRHDCAIETAVLLTLR